MGGVVASVMSWPHTFASLTLKHSVPWLLAGKDDWPHSADPSLGIYLAEERAAWPKVMTLLGHFAPSDKSKHVCGGGTDRGIKTGPLPQQFETTPKFLGGSVRPLLWLHHSSLSAASLTRRLYVRHAHPQQTSYLPTAFQGCLPGEPRA